MAQQQQQQQLGNMAAKQEHNRSQVSFVWPAAGRTNSYAEISVPEFALLSRPDPSRSCVATHKPVFAN